MTFTNFCDRLKTLIATAERMLAEPRRGKGEENTKDQLIVPCLEAWGYGPDYRTLEGAIRSLWGTTTWVDYLLRPEVGKHPKFMLEAKSLWQKNLWQDNKSQVLGYLRDYSLDIHTQEPVLWLILTNFREWHILRLQDKQPFWSFTLDDLKEDLDNNASLVHRIYDCFNRENLRGDRLESFYQEKHREELGARFLGDLKIWRLILANGIYQSQPQLSLEQIREAAQVILNRFLLIRLLETFSREMSFNYLGRVYYNWQQNFPDLPFIEEIRKVFRHTWVGYNTELFQASWIDELMIEVEYLEPIIIINSVPKEGILYYLTGNLTEYRSLYNYDFTTLTQDILGTAYEQFLAHQLVLTSEGIRILDNQQTRKQEGIFYTPDYIVKCIVQQTLEPLVKPIIDQAIAILAEGNFQQAYEVACSLFEIKILDPACGSGSFLLGAFDYLIAEIQRYNQACQQATIPQDFNLFAHTSVQSLVNAEERILVQMLYGVDRDPQAVLLAKLSLWTKLLRSRPGEYGKRNGSLYSHLPALTLNIRAGDSLISVTRELTEFTKSLSQGADLAKMARDQDLVEGERNHAVEELQELIQDINHQINPSLTGFFASDESLESVIYQIKKRTAQPKELELIRTWLIEDIFSDSKTNWLTKNLADWINSELERVQSMLMVLDLAVAEVIVKRPFNWRVEFPQIFDPRLPRDQQGFTVIIGNPPYFNVDATFGRGAPELRWLKFAYSDIYTDKTDILFYFFRRGYDLLQTGGQLSFIVSRAFIQGDKSAKLRGFLSQNTTIKGIIDFLGHRVFNAGIATCIIQLEKNSNSLKSEFNSLYITDLNQFKQFVKHQDLLNHSGIQVTVSQKNLELERWQISPYDFIFRQIDSVGQNLNQLGIGKFMKGIDTGLDAVFEGDFTKDFPTEYLLSRVAISDIDSFGYEVSKNTILYYTQDMLWQNLPQIIQDYLLSHRQALEQRKSYQAASYQWFHLHRSRVGLLNPKILFPRRAKNNRFVVDEVGNLGVKSDVAAYVLLENEPMDRLHYLCALLNSQVLEFRYRALGGLGKLTGKGMFEYFENQVGDLPIAWFTDPENHPDYQALVNLSKEAHALWQLRYQMVNAYHTKTTTIPYQEIPLSYYVNSTGDYALDIEWQSPEPNRTGHLLALRLEPLVNGWQLWGEITEDENWKDGDRQWLILATITVNLPHLHRYLLARLIYLTEFDGNFRRKQKLSKDFSNLLNTALAVLSVHCYDGDRFSNLRVLEVIEKRVEQELGRADLEQILLRQKQIQQQINDIAYRLYGVEDQKALIEQALTLVL